MRNRRASSSYSEKNEIGKFLLFFFLLPLFFLFFLLVLVLRGEPVGVRVQRLKALEGTGVEQSLDTGGVAEEVAEEKSTSTGTSSSRSSPVVVVGRELDPLLPLRTKISSSTARSRAAAATASLVGRCCSNRFTSPDFASKKWRS